MGRPTSVSIAVGLLCTALLASEDARAQWTTNGVRVAPSATPQWGVQAVSDDDGGAFYTLRESPYPYATRVRVQHLLDDGTVAPGWPSEGLRATDVESEQIAPVIVADGTGGVFVAWLDDRSLSGSQLYAQHLLANGDRDPSWPDEGLLVSSAHSIEPIIGCAPDGAGGLILARWTSEEAVNQIEVHRIGGSGVVHPGWPGIVPNTSGSLVRAVSDGTGGAIVAWLVSFVGTVAIRFGGDGQLASGWPAEGRVVAPGAFYDLLGDGSNGAFLSYIRGFDTYIQRLAGDGAVSAGWPTDGTRIVPSHGVAESPVLCPDGAGGIFVAWVLNPNKFLTDTDVYVSRMTGGGAVAPGWASDGVPVSSLPGFQNHPAVVADGEGGAILSWEDGRDSPQSAYDIYVQRITSSGAVSKGWPASGRSICTASGDQWFSAVISDGAGGGIVAWNDERNPIAQVYSGHIGTDGAVPTLAALVRAESTPEAVSLFWYAADAATLAATVERREGSGDWRSLGSPRVEDRSLLVFVDATVLPGRLYSYRLAIRSGNEVAYVGAVDIGVSLRPALSLRFTNDRVARSLLAHVILPGDQPARLEMFDLEGRRVRSLDLSGSVGEQVVPVQTANALQPGVYFGRLRQGAEQVGARVVVSR